MSNESITISTHINQIEMPFEWMRLSRTQEGDKRLLTLDIDLVKWHAAHNLPYENHYFTVGLLSQQLDMGSALFFKEFLPQGAEKHLMSERDGDDAELAHDHPFLSVPKILHSMFGSALKSQVKDLPGYAELMWSVETKQNTGGLEISPSQVLSQHSSLYHTHGIVKTHRNRSSEYTHVSIDWMYGQLELNKILDHVTKARSHKGHETYMLELDALEARLRQHFA